MHDKEKKNTDDENTLKLNNCGIFHRTYPLLLISLSLPIITSIARYIFLFTSKRNNNNICGFSVPGKSPLWAHQSSSCFLDSTHEFVWLPTGIDSVPSIKMFPLDSAIEVLDEGVTTIPIIAKADKNTLGVKLRGQMLPHIIKGGLWEELSGNDNTMISNIFKNYDGEVKFGSKKGYVDGYFGSNNSIATLQEYLLQSHQKMKKREHLKDIQFTSDDTGYWVGCEDNIVRVDEEKVAKWLNRTKNIMAALSLPGLKRSVLNKMCLRVTTELSRIPFHIDSFHGQLGQINGQRRILMMMPDMAARMYYKAVEESVHTATLKNSGYKRKKGWISQVDPRNILEISRSKQFPLAQDALTVTATLNAGDVLHIPVGWGHYIEPVPIVQRESQKDNFAFNAAISYRVAATHLKNSDNHQDKEEGDWMEHPC